MLPYGYYTESGTNLPSRTISQVVAFLETLGLDYDKGVDYTTVIYSDKDEVIGTGSIHTVSIGRACSKFTPYVR